MADEDREDEEGLVGEWKVGLLRRGAPVLSDRAELASVPDRVTADRVVLRGLAGIVGEDKSKDGGLQKAVSGGGPAVSTTLPECDGGSSRKQGWLAEGG